MNTSQLTGEKDFNIQIAAGLQARNPSSSAVVVIEGQALWI
jgi:hypothetical protein